MNNFGRKRLGDLLLEVGKISAEQLGEALQKQKKFGKKLGEVLTSEGIITEEEILDVLEKQLGIPRVIIDMVNVDKNAVLSIPEVIASKHNLFPFEFNGNQIMVAMSDPLNIFAVDDVKIASGYDVGVFISSKEEIKKAISKYYSNQGVQNAAEALNKEKQGNKESEAEKVTVDDIKNAPAVRLVDSIVKNAIEARASDIHIEPFEKYVNIRYRVDGQLEEVLRSSKETLAALVTRIKILSDLNIAEKRIPQDGRILMELGDKQVDLRVSTLPTVHGEKVVIRILKRESTVLGKEQFGMPEEDLEKLNRIIKSPNGIILVTGPTGSGKTTTLYTILNELNSSDKNIITVEDPVEYMLEGINQVNVNVKAGLDFAAGLRSILRQDPDIIMIGEIRDTETAQIATRAAITGHLVLSTIHTNDAPSSVLRLVDMGIEPYLVASTISGVISQRLVRKICPQCKVAYEANEYERKALELVEGEIGTLYKGEGCPHCGNLGYIGRVGVYEIMEVTRELRNVIMSSNSSDEIADLAIQKGMKTLNVYGRGLVLNGITTLEELLKITHLKE